MTEPEAAPREGERCALCGTPMEVAEVTPHDDTHVNDLVLRCANGHEKKVSRHEDETADETLD